MSTTLLEEVPPPRLDPVAGRQGRPATSVGPAGRPRLRRLRWTGATIFAVIVLGLVVSLRGLGEPGLRPLGAELPVVGDLQRHQGRLPDGDLHHRDAHHHRGGHRPGRARSAWAPPPSSPSSPPNGWPGRCRCSSISSPPSRASWSGLWGLLVLSPVFARHVEPFLKTIPVPGVVLPRARLRAEHAAGRHRSGRHDPAHHRGAVAHRARQRGHARTARRPGPWARRAGRWCGPRWCPGRAPGSRRR